MTKTTSVADQLYLVEEYTYLGMPSALKPPALNVWSELINRFLISMIVDCLVEWMKNGFCGFCQPLELEDLYV